MFFVNNVFIYLNVIKMKFVMEQNMLWPTSLWRNRRTARNGHLHVFVTHIIMMTHTHILIL